MDIRSYTTDDYTAVRELFAEGMIASYAVGNTNEGLRNYVARSLLLDMGDIQGTYFGSGGHFWVATLKQNGTEVIVGTIALEGKGDRRGELRRLSIRADHRRMGIAHRLVTHSENWAKAHGYDVLFLTTGSEMGPAISLYNALGYTAYQDVPSKSNPGKTLISFEKTLHATS